jgi:hypothetical protein
MRESLVITDKIDVHKCEGTQDFFITCSSFEDRCLGVPQRLSEKLQFKSNYVFIYEVPSKKRDENLQKLEKSLSPRGPINRISTSESDPQKAISVLYKDLREYKERIEPSRISITLDITTFTKRHLFLLFKSIDDLELWDNTRILYTEPEKYVTDLYLPMSIGLRTISPIGGFISNSPPNLPLLLIVFLGYEGDRARAIYENLEPEETILIVPKPAYHDEWEGTTEKMNQSLIKMVGKDKIEYADSIDPSSVTERLQEISDRYKPTYWKRVIVPLGTKPQIVGIYFFWRRFPNTFSVLYAQPFKHNETFFSTGIGRTWLLKARAE